MAKNFSDRAQQRIIGQTTDWITKFDVNVYLDNRPLIEKLYEERQLALSRAYDAEKELADTRRTHHELELEHERLQVLNRSLKRKSVSIFGVSLVATLLAAIGVNVATDSPESFLGWAIVVASIMLEIVAFLMVRDE